MAKFRLAGVALCECLLFRIFLSYVSICERPRYKIATLLPLYKHLRKTGKSLESAG
jgi:hypothetical protein